MTDRALIVAALIIGGAIITASYQTRGRYALSAADNRIVWRMDTWSGNIDLCSAQYAPQGPVVRCGAFIVIPGDPSKQDNKDPGTNPPDAAPPPTLPGNRL